MLSRFNGHAAGESLPSSSNGPSEGDPIAAAEIKVERTEDSKAGRGVDQKLPRGRGGRRGRPPSSKRMKVQEEAEIPAGRNLTQQLFWMRFLVLDERPEEW